MLDADTFTSPESQEIALLAAGAAIQAARPCARRAGAGVRAGPAAGPSRGARPRDGLLPVQQRRGRRRRTRSRAGSRASPSSTSTCTTATARSGCSTTIRRVLYVSTHQFPFYPGTGAADEVGRGRGRGLHRQRAARGGRDRRRLRARRTGAIVRPCSISSRRSCCSSRPASTRTSDDPLASMRMTAAGYAADRAALARRRGAARCDRARHRGRLRPAGARRVPRGVVRGARRAAQRTRSN